MPLNPLQNRWDQENKAKKADPSLAPLNPPFPFRVVNFDPATFGLDQPPLATVPTPALDTQTPATT